MSETAGSLRAERIAVLPLLLSAVALAGCGGTRHSETTKRKPEKPTITYTAGMRLWSLGNTTIVDLCRGPELVHEVFSTRLEGKKLYNSVDIHTTPFDPKCADDTITPRDFREAPIPPTDTSTGSINI